MTGQLGLHPSSQQIWVCGFFASKHRGYTWSPTVCRDLTYICLSFLDREESDTIVILILKITRGWKLRVGTGLPKDTQLRGCSTEI